MSFCPFFFLLFLEKGVFYILNIIFPIEIVGIMKGEYIMKNYKSGGLAACRQL